ncbi:MAG: polyprenyl synthetase family protein [Rickettsiales bacterium]|nr:polyprenyl synthetase family protein [Rickettsiales bacterium]
MIFYDDQHLPNDLIEIYETIKLRKKAIRANINRIINEEFSKDTEKIGEIIRYVALSGETYYRSFLVEILGNLFDVQKPKQRFIATILEFLHTADVMQSSLPEIDNEMFRHNSLSCYQKFGKEMTIIAHSALVSLVFYLISSENNNVSLKKNEKCKLIEILSSFNGKDGVSTRQIMKVMSKKKQTFFKDEIIRMHKLKLQTFFLAGCECITYLSGQNKDTTRLSTNYVNNICGLLEILDGLITNNNNNYLTNIPQDTIDKADILLKQAILSTELICDKLNIDVKNGKQLIDFAKFIAYTIQIESKKYTNIYTYNYNMPIATSIN